MTDRERWGNRQSYKPAWDERSRLAAALVPDGARVLEVGAGTGILRQLISQRTDYVGFDLEPLDPSLMPLDLDAEPLPAAGYDYAVALGVFCYLHHPEEAARKLCVAARRVIASYCCVKPHPQPERVLQARVERGWLNHFDKPQFLGLFTCHGHRVESCTSLTDTDELEEFLLVFEHAGTSRDRGAQTTPLAIE